MKKLNNLECVYEKVFVETPVDSDGDGMRDLIAVYITRPKDASKENPVPAVMVANPYLMFCNEDWYDLHDVNHELKSYPNQDLEEPDVLKKAGASTFGEYITEVSSNPGESGIRPVNDTVSSNIVDELPEFECISNLYEYLNQKGYASVFSGGLGTRGSDGMTLCGSADEIAAFRSIIDWLNGRARAFTDKESGIEVEARWCTGNVAMSGKSYLGTLCFGVAATGVEGLKAIIPEAGISNWYNYYRNNGLVVPPFDWQGDDSDLLSLYCASRAKDADDFALIEKDYREKLAEMIAAEDRDSGNYNEFWDARNYLKHADEFKAAVFIIHGLNDWNVKPDQALPMFRALEKAGIDRRMMLHQGEHIYIYDLKDSGALEAVESWLDHYLKGIDNGVESEPKVLVESNLDQSKWLPSNTWPPENMNHKEFPIEGKGERIILDDISVTGYNFEDDDRKSWRDKLVLSEEASRYSVRFVTDEIKEDLRISGFVDVRFMGALDKLTGILSAMLVDLGEDRRITAEEIISGGENPDEFTFGLEKDASSYKVITRGWINAQNRRCIWSKEETPIGEYLDYHFQMVPTDYSVRAGHRLALILYGTDCDFTIRSKVVTTIKYDMESIHVSLPLV